MTSYPPPTGLEAFAGSFAVFCGLVDGLIDPAAGPMELAQLESDLMTARDELLRQVVQDRINLLSRSEPRREKVADAAGVAHSRVEAGHQRSVGTVFGPVTVTRMAYRAPGAANLYPLDAVLNLPERKYSHTVEAISAIEAARGSFEEAGAALARYSGAAPAKRQTEALAQAAAADIGAFYASRSGPAPGTEDDLLVLTGDAKGVVMRPEALRPATAALAAAAAEPGNARLTPAHARGRKRMAEVGCVYDASPVVRRPDQVMRRSDSERTGGPVAANKWMTASISDDAAAVIEAVFDEAEARDPEHRRTWIVLLDGNRHQIEVCEREARTRGVTIHIVCDFIHVLEYCWAAARSLFNTGNPAAERWVIERADQILTGHTLDAAASIRAATRRAGFTSGGAKDAERAAAYLEAKAPYLDYATALASGWPIATGIIEGAVRYLVKDRMDITGARWGLAGGEAILGLRALRANGDFDEYWAFHMRKDHERNHRARYLDYDTQLTLAA